MTGQTGTGFLKLGTTDLWGWVILCWGEGRSERCRMVGSPWPLAPSCQTPTILMTKDISGHRQMSPRFLLRATGLEGQDQELILNCNGRLVHLCLWPGHFWAQTTVFAPHGHFLFSRLALCLGCFKDQPPHCSLCWGSGRLAGWGVGRGPWEHMAAPWARRSEA